MNQETATRRRRTTADEVDTASVALSELYNADIRVSAIAPPAFPVVADTVTDESMSIVRLHCGSGEATAERFRDWVVVMCARGRMNWRVDGRAGSGHAPFIVRPSEPVHNSFSDVDLITVRLSAERMEAAASVHGGRLPEAGAHRRDARYLAAVLHQLDWMLRSTPDVFDSPLVMSSVRQSVVGAVMAGFGDRDDAETSSASRSVRRAVAYIDEHLADPLTVTEIAEAAGLSIRALEYAFRRHFGATPTQLVRKRRLAKTHSELQRADPRDTTVRDIALRWGFAHHSRFARDYRAEYGRFPSETLRS